MKKTIFIKNAVILTVSSLILRFAGIIFKVWIAKFIGSEGVGLYQLIFSFYMLAATFATSGISTAVTRLISEELALGSKKGISKILRRSIELTLILAVGSMVLVFFSSGFIAKNMIGDVRALPALKILPLSLPFMGLCSCFRGYFIAVRRVTPNAFSQIFEQIVRISLVFILVKAFISKGLAAACGALLLGDVAAEIISCSFLGFMYLKDTKKLKYLSGRARPPYKVVHRISHIAWPITSGRYLNTALRTAENILVPKNLARYPFSGNSALSQFGMIKGMALPILFFPSTLLNSISTLLIPEMSEASAKNQKSVVKNAVEKILKLTCVISIIFAAIFLVGGEKIGEIIYRSKDVGFLLKALSPIVPFMYLDSISDGILKGLDQQVFSFRTSIFDSTLRIILILLILPIFGIKGFLGIMYFSNFLTCFLNVKQLLKVSGAELKIFKEILIPVFFSVSLSLTVNFILEKIGIFNNLVFLLILILICLPIYLIFLQVSSIIKKEEFLQIFSR